MEKKHIEEKERKVQQRQKEEGDTTELNTENIISLTHAADPAKPSGLKGISYSHPLPISLTHTLTFFNTTLVIAHLEWPLCHQPCQRSLLSKKEKQKERNSGQNSNKGRCLLEWIHGVSTAHRRKADQCHCWDFLICSSCCCGTTGDTHDSSNYCHLFRCIVLVSVSPSMSWCYHFPREFTSVLQHRCMPSWDVSAITEPRRLWLLTIGDSTTEVVILTRTPCQSDRD